MYPTFSVVQYDEEGFGNLVSQFEIRNAIEKLQSVWQKSLEESKRYTQEEVEQLANDYKRNIRRAFSFLDRTGEFVIVSATIDPLIEKHKEDKDEKKRPLYQIYEIENKVEGSACTVKYMVFHCANEEEAKKIESHY